MKCNRCGFEAATEFSYCPSCGSPQTYTAPVTPPPVNVAATRVFSVLQDKLFLVLCILMSVTCGLSLFSGGLDVISTLFTIFLWLTYARMKKGVVSAKYLRCISGTMYAQYVVVTVASAIIIVAGVILAISLNFLLSSGELTAELHKEISRLNPEFGSFFADLDLTGLGVLVGVIYSLVGVAMLVINLFSNRYIHRFAKSVYMGVNSGTLQLKHTNATVIWLYIFAGFQVLSCLINLFTIGIFSLLSSGVACAMSIVAALLIKKYLVDAPKVEALPQ